MKTIKKVKLGTLITPAKVQRCGDGDYPVLSMTMHNGLVFQSDKFKKSVASQDKSTYKVVHRNQLVIGFPIDEGVLATQRITDAGIVSPAYGIWDVEQEKIIPEFLEYALRCNRAIDYYKAKLRGSTARRRSLPTPTLLELEVPLPSLEQQDRILTLLRHARNALDGRQQQLTALDNLIKARFLEVFGDLANPRCSWKKEKLINVCANPEDIKCGPFGTQLSKDEYQPAGVAIWEIPQINSGFTLKPTHFLTHEKALQLEAYSIISGDIAMSRKGNVGRCAIFPEGFEDGIIHSDVLRIRLDKKQAVPIFMMHQLHNSGFVKHQIELVSSGAIMAGVNVTKLKEIEVHLPPLSLQNDFAAFVEEVDKSRAEVQKALEQTQLLFDSLMQQYFG